MGLFVNFLFDSGNVRFGEVDRNEDDLRVDTMLGLGEEVGGYKGSVGCLVCNDLERTEFVLNSEL